MSAKDVRNIRGAQEKVSALSFVIMQHMRGVQNRLMAEDCTGAWRMIEEIKVMLGDVARTRQQAGLAPVGPFGQRAASQLAALAQRVEGACGGALAYERRF
jgi:uncharacterized protein YbaR (Trm112 family)